MSSLPDINGVFAGGVAVASWAGHDRLTWRPVCGRLLRVLVSRVSAELSVLLDRCAAHDRAAFEQLYRQQSALLFGLALRITRQTSLAADAVQEALLQVWQNAARFDPSRGAPEAWLLGLVRYRALDIVRRRQRETVQDDFPDAADDAPDALTQMMSTAEGAALVRCLETLPTERQRLIRLAFTDGLSHSELSAMLNEPLGTVKSWIRRALSNLRACLAS